MHRIAVLFDSYEREVTPGKSRHARQHDRTTAALFLECVGRRRPVASLNRRDWDHGRQLVDRHPFRGLELPREDSPRRPRLSDADYRAMLKATDGMHPHFRLALVLAHETGHRIGGIRMLRWSDVDLKALRIRWRAENDKIGFEHTTALTSDAVAALDTARTRQAGIGDARVFPSVRQRGQPTGPTMFRLWWDRAEVRAKLTPAQGRGWHSLRRSFATELKHAPLADLAYLSGWKSATELLHDRDVWAWVELNYRPHAYQACR